MGVSPSHLRAAGGVESSSLSTESRHERSKRRVRGASALLATIGGLATCLDPGEASSSASGGSGTRQVGPGGPQPRGAFVFLRQGHRTLPGEVRQRAGGRRLRRSCDFSSLLVPNTAATAEAIQVAAAAGPAGTFSNRRHNRSSGSSSGGGSSSCSSGGGCRYNSPLRRHDTRGTKTLLVCSAVERDATASPIGISPAALGHETKPNHHNGEDNVEEHHAGWSAQLARPQWGPEGCSQGARRRRRDLEASWLEDPGRDLPFEFADLHEAMTLPCSIQLFPRVERRSLVYVDGREAPSYRARKYTAATIDRRPADRAAAGSGRGGGDRRRAAAAVHERSQPEESGTGDGGQGRTGRGGGSSGGGSNGSSNSISSSSSSSSSSGSDGSRIRSEGSRVGAGPPSEPVAADRSVTTAEKTVGAGTGVHAGLQQGERRTGDTIRLVGEMDIDKPAYLQIQEGENGGPDALLVSQFGFTRGGAVSRVNLDPTPRLPRLLADAAAVAGDGKSPNRTQPRLTGTWAGPLLWPNEVNQLPAEALVRLTQGRAAEIRYKAERNIAAETAGGADSHPSRTGQDAKGSNEGRSGKTDAASLDAEYDGSGGRKASLRFESEQFNLLRRESDKFSDADITRRLQERAPLSASLSLLSPEPPPPPPSAPRPGTESAPTTGVTPEVGNPADSWSQKEEPEEEEHEAQSPPPPPPLPSSTSRSSSTAPPAWDGPLPEEAAGFLIADGFLIPGKADGGVYLVVPTAAEEKGFPMAGGGGGGGGSRAEGNRSRAAGSTAGTEAAERILRLTSPKRGWFYHKAVWVVLPGGKKVVLTARVTKPIFGQAQGELVLLEMPRVDHPLSEPNLPWREKVLVRGPDVMFEVVDLDPEDSTVQVVCAEFFGGRVTMHSLCGGTRPGVTESWVLDENAGPAYSISAVDLRGGSPGGRPTHFLVTTHESSYNSYSFFAGSGGFNANSYSTVSTTTTTTPAAATAAARPAFGMGFSSITTGTAAAAAAEVGGADGAAVDTGARRRSTTTDFDPAGARALGGANVGSGRPVPASPARPPPPPPPPSRGGGGRWGGVVTGGPKERRWQRREEGGTSGAGGSLLAYEIPEDWRSLPRFYPAPGWLRATLASGFRVRGLSINPGTPGFPYVFHPHRSMEGKQPPYIAVAGDCSQSAYIFRPVAPPPAEEEAKGSWEQEAAPLSYEIACSIEVPGTVGSLAVSYGPLLGGAAATTARPASMDVEPPPLSEGLFDPGVPGPYRPTSPSSSPEDEDNLWSTQQQRRKRGDGWAKLFVPNYDGNKVYVFSMEPEAHSR